MTMAFAIASPISTVLTLRVPSVKMLPVRQPASMTFCIARSILDFIPSTSHPDTTLIVFAFPRDYSFGILQSGIHWEWFKARCSTLESRLRYTSDSVFDAFPWPRSPTREQIAEVVDAAVLVRALRRKIMGKLG